VRVCVTLAIVVAMATLAYLARLPGWLLSCLPFQCSWLGFFDTFGPYPTLAIDVMDVAVRELTRGTRPISSGVQARIKSTPGAMTVADTTAEMATSLNERARDLVGRQLGPPWIRPSFLVELKYFFRGYKPVIFTIYVVLMCYCLCSGLGQIFCAQKTVFEELLENLGLPSALLELSTPNAITWIALVFLLWVVFSTFDTSRWTPIILFPWPKDWNFKNIL
jgi:hypothetical protein